MGLTSRGLVKQQFTWRHYYWVLTNEGIEYLREYLHLPPEIVPVTMKKQAKIVDNKPRVVDVLAFQLQLTHRINVINIAVRRMPTLAQVVPVSVLVVLAVAPVAQPHPNKQENLICLLPFNLTGH